MNILSRAWLPVVGLSLAISVLAVPEKAAAGPNAFIGDIVSVGFNFCPSGWLSAEGQLLPISQNTALFSLIGTTYGGNGQTTFALPDLRGRIGMGQGQGPGLTSHLQGQMFGAESHTLVVSELPSHNHPVNANNLDGNFGGPGGKLLAAAPAGGSGSETIYSDMPANRTMAASMIAASGGNVPLSIEDPFLVLRYCVATVGVYPPRP